MKDQIAAGVEPGDDGSARRPGFEAAMRSELDHLLHSQSFAKSPQLSKLLNYLVNETLKGNGDRLKSYSIAVDCLGRPPDFDAQSDSYPRVQTLRLRKLLESFYAKQQPSNGLCIFLVAGSCRVRLGRPETAYPQLYRPMSTNKLNPAVPPKDPGQGVAPNEAAMTDIQSRTAPAARSKPIFILLAAALLIIAIGLAYQIPSIIPAANRHPAHPPSPPDLPLIAIQKVEAQNRDKADAADVFAKLADGIGRSWAVKVQLPQISAPTQGETVAEYRLSTRIGNVHDKARRIYFNLVDSRTAELLWSESRLLDDSKPLSENLGPAIAELAGPFGVVATRELRATGDEERSEYTCLLHYIDFLKTQNPAIRTSLSSCLSTPFESARLDSVRLALLSFFLLETATPQNRKMRLQQAEAMARQSMAADPNEAYSHFAMARIQYAISNCETGNIHTKIAVERNPYDPVILAVLGNLALECGYPDANLLVDRAFALRPPGESFARLSLILSSIRDGDRERLLLLSSEGTTAYSTSPAYHHLCETLLSAALGNNVAARREWRLFVAASSTDSKSPDAVLGQIILSDQVRQRVIFFLRSKDVLPT